MQWWASCPNPKATVNLDSSHRKPKLVRGLMRMEFSQVLQPPACPRLPPPRVPCLDEFSPPFLVLRGHEECSAPALAPGRGAKDYIPQFPWGCIHWGLCVIINFCLSSV